MEISHLQMLKQSSLLNHISLKAIQKLVDGRDFMLDFMKNPTFVWIACYRKNK